MAAAVAQAEIAHPSPFGIKPPLTTLRHPLFPDIKYLNAPPYLQQEHGESRHQAEAHSALILL